MPDDIFDFPLQCFSCGCDIPDGEGRTPDGYIYTDRLGHGVIGRVFCPACWEKGA